jgi:hypothetical protein
MIERRRLLTGIGALFITAPAIVRSASIMAINPALTPPAFPAKLVFVTTPLDQAPIERMRITADWQVLIRNMATGRMEPVGLPGDWDVAHTVRRVRLTA